MGPAPDEPARPRDHLSLRELEEGGGQRNSRDEDDERRDDRAQTRVGDVVPHRERDDRRDAGGGEERHQGLDRPAPVAETPEGADERAQHCRARDVARGRMEDQRDSDGEDCVPDDARHVTEPVVHPSDRVEPLDADGRCDLPPLRVARERVDCRDLIEAGRPGEPRRGLDRRRLPLAEREQDECREGAEPGVAQLVRPRDHPEPRLHGVHRLADRAQRRAERRKEQQDVVILVLTGDVLRRHRSIAERARAGGYSCAVTGAAAPAGGSPRARFQTRSRITASSGDDDDRDERLRSVAHRVDREEGEHDQRHGDADEDEPRLRARLPAQPVAGDARRGRRSRASRRFRPRRSPRGRRCSRPRARPLR